MTTLNYDANGFIVGINRMKDGIDNVHDDTQEIIQILKSQNQISNTRMRELTRAVKSANYRSESQASASASRTRSNLLDRQPRISSSASTDSDNTRNRNRASNRSTVSRNSSSAADRNRNTTNSNSEDNGSNRRSSSTTRRERDANGRFISDSNESKRGFGLSGLSGMGRSDVSGVDPLIDSLREAKDLLSPIGRAGKLAGRAAKFSWSKFKSMKRREPLSNDETRHNRENEKLLDKIWKAIRRTGGNGNGGGLLGGLLPFGLGRNRPGGGGGILGKLKNIFKGVGGIKGLGLLATVASSASLAMDWGNLNHEQKSEGVGGIGGAMAGGAAGAALGATIGSVIPGLGTAVGGLVGGLAGAWLGSEAGQELGRVASPYIQSWTKKLIDYNLPEKILSVWKDGIKPFFLSFMHKGQEAGSWLGGGFNGGKVKRGEGFPKSGDGGDGGSSNSVWTGETANLKGTSEKAVHTASQYKAGNIGGLDDAMTRRLVASTVQTESSGGNPSTINSGGYLGRYQAGAAWLADAGMIRGGANAVKEAKKRDGYGDKSDWSWATSGGMTKFLKDSRNWTEGMSREKYLANPDIQDKAFQKATSKSYDQLNRMGAITSNTSQTEVAGLLKAAHLGGAGNANKVAKGGTGATDANGTSTRKYYNDIVQNKDGLNAAIRKNTIVKDVLTVEPAKKKGGEIAKTPASKSNGSANAINKPVTPKANISKKSAGKPLLKAQGYAPVNLPTAPVLKIPDALKIKERLDSGGGNKPMMLQSSNDTINQNLSDRGLAHAVTGGFGQDRMWG